MWKTTTSKRQTQRNTQVFPSLFCHFFVSSSSFAICFSASTSSSQFLLPLQLRLQLALLFRGAKLALFVGIILDAIILVAQQVAQAGEDAPGELGASPIMAEALFEVIFLNCRLFLVFVGGRW